MQLNEDQRRAVESNADTEIVAAGPGSGKTRVVVERVKHLVASGINPRRIIVITYTNAAAHVLAERLAPMVLGYIGTLHGYCSRLIQTFGAELGYRPGMVSIVTEQAQKEILTNIRKRLGSKISTKALEANDSPEAQLVWDEYRHTLKHSNMVDYDRILTDGLALLRLGITHRPHALLVDEGQDSAPIDWEIYDKIGAQSLTIVGDTDQSIYTFRGADPTIFLHAARMAEDDGNLVKLPVNYRSDKAIIKAANSLISYNMNRVDKPIVPRPDTGDGYFDIAQFENAASEVLGAYRMIVDQHPVGGPTFEFGQCAILARTNAVADFARKQLDGMGLPMKRSRAFMPADWGTMLAVLSFVVDPCNDYHAEQVLKARGVHQLEINRRKLTAISSGVSLGSAGGLLIERPASLMDTLRVLQQLAPISQESIALVRQRIELLPNDDATVTDLLADLWKHDKWAPDMGGDGVTVTTIHGAKGKEWDLVIILGCEMGVLPLAKGDLEDERRMMFVAITRARHTVICSFARHRTAYGKTTEQQPSVFLEEMR